MISEQGRFSGVVKTLGPGILFAGAAIGGSHLVQSTRAGADFGFDLIWIVLLVNLFKYPFFEFSHRYTAATGESLLDGYKRIGSWALWLFFLLAIVAAILNAAAVTLITAGLAGLMLDITLSPLAISAVVLFIVCLILLIGKYPLLDALMKIMVLVLGLCTIVAVTMAFLHGPVGAPDYQAPDLWTLASFSFIIALMGWMPGPIDISVWPSLWGLERKEQTQHKPTLNEALVDFHAGYLSTVMLALAFVCLGALVMFGTGEQFANSGLKFSGQLVTLYTKTLGGWSFGLIAIVAFITMFSTTLTVFDGYTRTLKGSMELIRNRQATRGGVWYWGILFVLICTSLLIIGAFISGMRTLLDIVTIISFLSAPPFAYLNFKAATLPHVPEEFRPRPWLRVLAWAGMAFLTLFSLTYLVWRLMSL